MNMKNAMRVLRNRRGDISSPIIVILVTVAALAVAGVAITWMASAGSSATSTSVVYVLGTPVLLGNQISITLKNAGSNSILISNATLTVGNSTYYASNISPNSTSGGSATNVIITLTPTPSGVQPGQSYMGSILTNQGTIVFSAVAQ